MKDIIFQYVRQYLPTIFTLLLSWIAAWGMKKLSDSFDEKIGKKLDADKIANELNKTKEELRGVYEELKETKKELKEVAEALKKVKGTKK